MKAIINRYLLVTDPILKITDKSNFGIALGYLYMHPASIVPLILLLSYTFAHVLSQLVEAAKKQGHKEGIYTESVQFLVLTGYEQQYAMHEQSFYQRNTNGEKTYSPDYPKLPLSCFLDLRWH